MGLTDKPTKKKKANGTKWLERALVLGLVVGSVYATKTGFFDKAYSTVGYAKDKVVAMHKRTMEQVVNKFTKDPAERINEFKETFAKQKDEVTNKYQGNVIDLANTLESDYMAPETRAERDISQVVEMINKEPDYTIDAISNRFDDEARGKALYEFFTDLSPEHKAGYALALATSDQVDLKSKTDFAVAIATRSDLDDKVKAEIIGDVFNNLTPEHQVEYAAGLAASQAKFKAPVLNKFNNSDIGDYLFTKTAEEKKEIIFTMYKDKIPNIVKELFGVQVQEVQ